MHKKFDTLNGVLDTTISLISLEAFNDSDYGKDYKQFNNYYTKVQNLLASKKKINRHITGTHKKQIM